MKKYFCLTTGILALGTEVLVFVSLMEMQPFRKGGSDIIWGFAILWIGRSCARDFWAPRRTQRQTKLNTRQENGYGRVLVKRSQSRNSNFGARFSSWSPPHFRRRPNESLNQNVRTFLTVCRIWPVQRLSFPLAGRRRWWMSLRFLRSSLHRFLARRRRQPCRAGSLSQRTS